jgi:hypothetical protein
MNNPQNQKPGQQNQQPGQGGQQHGAGSRVVRSPASKASSPVREATRTDRRARSKATSRSPARAGSTKAPSATVRKIRQYLQPPASAGGQEFRCGRSCVFGAPQFHR